MPIMVAVAVVCIPIFWTRGTIQRWEGILFLCFYASYTVVLIMAAKDPEIAACTGLIVKWGVWPIMIATCLASVYLNRKKPQQA